MPHATPDLFRITTAQLRALRHADTVCFDANADGSGDIRAIVREEHSSTGFDQEVRFPVQNRSRRMDGRTGHESMSSYHEGWRTIVQHVLRVGDAIVLEFRPDDGTNDYAKAAKGDPSLLPDNGEHRGSLHYTGLHVDEFWLVIERHKTKSDEVDKQLYFAMEVRVTPENSARMCSKGQR